MKKITYIPGHSTPVKERPVEFTHEMRPAKGWEVTENLPKQYVSVVYLGNCIEDGDMFGAYAKDGSICIYKGNLNSGKII
jgi:hypothetical protein